MYKSGMSEPQNSFLTDSQPIDDNPQPTQTCSQEESMEWSCFQDKKNSQEWRVEANDYRNEGVVYVAIFSGPHARERAEEYAALKNGQESRSLRRAS
jgi:hypothetical protein